jgi:hypothetical protein
VEGVLERLKSALANRYLIERELGSGGMATVYLARDLKHDRPVALKVLRPELVAVLGAERFLAEIRITAKLDHPHILTLIDSGEAAGLLYYVLPYVQGESLRARLEREKQLGIEEALRITRQVASALDYAHRHGVIHRDIKPENVLLFENEAMLADFGIALAVREAGGNRLTESGLSLGTPQYMSPEQATGDRTLDARSDVYSLGAVLYEMLAGEPPVTGPTVQAVIAKLLTERPVRLRSVRDAVPERLEAAVAKALAKVPADRFASAAAFAAALEAAEAAPAETPRRGRWLVPAAVVGVVVVVVAVASIWGLVRGRPAAPPRELERIQVTFTGNAGVPAISEDGQRVAYAARQCDEGGGCTEDIVVQDVGGAGSVIVTRGLTWVGGIHWSADGRYLLFDGSFFPLTGVFSVPSLGGEALYLGCCSGRLTPGGDTALVALPPRGDSLASVRWVTIADGVVHDSVFFPGSWAVGDLYAEAFPDGRRLFLTRSRWDYQDAFIVTRTGEWIDSLHLEGPRESFYQPAFLSPEGDALLTVVPRGGAPGDLDVLAYGVDPNGRIARPPDTLLRRLPARYGASVARNRMLVYAGGPVEHVLWALRRTSPDSMRFEERRLLSATGSLIGRLSPTGARVLAGRGVPVGDRRLVQLSVLPFDGGPETLLSPPQDLVDADWVQDGKSVMITVRRDADSVAVLRLDAASGRSEPVGIFAADQLGNLRPLPQGGLLVTTRSGRELRRMGVPGLADSTFHLPEGAYEFYDIDPSPDGRDFVSASWATGWDSIMVHRISLTDGGVTRLASFTEGAWVEGARWLADGTIIVEIAETDWNLAWYRVPEAGGQPVRLGTAPHYPADYSFSADGQRVVALAKDVRSDVYLIRNFGEMLRR